MPSPPLVHRYNINTARNQECAWLDSNQQSLASEANALSIELQAPTYFTRDTRINPPQGTISIPCLSSSSKIRFMPMESEDMCPTLITLMWAVSASFLWSSDKCIAITVPMP